MSSQANDVKASTQTTEPTRLCSCGTEIPDVGLTVYDRYAIAFVPMPTRGVSPLPPDLVGPFDSVEAAGEYHKTYLPHRPDLVIVPMQTPSSFVAYMHRMC